MCSAQTHAAQSAQIVWDSGEDSARAGEDKRLSCDLAGGPGCAGAAGGGGRGGPRGEHRQRRTGKVMPRPWLPRVPGLSRPHVGFFSVTAFLQDSLPLAICDHASTACGAHRYSHFQGLFGRTQAMGSHLYLFLFLGREFAMSDRLDRLNCCLIWACKRTYMLSYGFVIIWNSVSLVVAIL